MPFDVSSLEHHWMPFSGNRDFKTNPRLVVKSEGMYCWDYKGGQLIDGSSGLFCTPAGHGRQVGARAAPADALDRGPERLAQREPDAAGEPRTPRRARLRPPALPWVLK